MISPTQDKAIPIGTKVKWFHRKFSAPDQEIIKLIQEEKITDIILTGGKSEFKNFTKVEQMLDDHKIISTTNRMPQFIKAPYHYMMVNSQDILKGPIFGAKISVNSTSWENLVAELVKNGKIPNVIQSKVAIVSENFDKDEKIVKSIQHTTYENGLELRILNISDQYVFKDLKKADADVIILSWSKSFGGQ